MIRRIKKGNQIFDYDMSDMHKRNMFFRDLDSGFKEWRE